MGFRTRKPKGPKKVAYRLIDKETATGKTLYAMLDELLEKDRHDEIACAKIALAWRDPGWKPDVDGRQKLGQMKKASDLDREFRPFDAVILLNRAFFESPTAKDMQRRAILDHELCHLTRKYDTNHEPMEDDRGRAVYRLVRHDLEEFQAVVSEYGFYKRDIEAFYRACKQSPQLSLLDQAEKSKGNGKEKAAETEDARTIPPRHADAKSRPKAKQNGAAAAN